MTSVAKLADVARQDPEFHQVGELYRDDPAFDIARLVAELVEAESVPLLPVLRYKPSSLRKRDEWEKTWALQRQEDAIDARTKLPKDHPDYLTELDAKALKKKQVGTIPVPPKYTSADFLKSDYWRLRGKLDVPKERWVSFPHCEGVGRHARRRLGRLRPPPARPGDQRLLRRRPRTSRRPRRPPPRPAPGLPDRATSLAQAVAQ